MHTYTQCDHSVHCLYNILCVLDQLYQKIRSCIETRNTTHIQFAVIHDPAIYRAMRNLFFIQHWLIITEPRKGHRTVFLAFFILFP